MENPIKVALDSCTVINLAHFVNPKNDPTGEVHKLLEEKKSMYPKFRFVEKSELPPILQDDYLGKIEIINGKKYYKNLLDVHNLLQSVKSGDVQLCITKTVFNELNLERHLTTKSFVEKYIHIVTIPDELARTFAIRRTKLAREYVEKNAMDDEYSAKEEERVPSNDAYIMAEATIVGLTLITHNEKDFLFRNISTKDWDRVKLIAKINAERNYLFPSNMSGTALAPQPINLSSFGANYKHLKDGDCNRPFVITECNLNQNYEYSL